MMDIKKARKQLIRVGCSKAEGDVLRFMYANLLAFEQRLSTTSNSLEWPIPDLYKELGEEPDSRILIRVQEIRDDHQRRT